jgi:hypothetical protein
MIYKREREHLATANPVNLPLEILALQQLGLK